MGLFFCNIVLLKSLESFVGKGFCNMVLFFCNLASGV